MQAAVPAAEEGLQQATEQLQTTASKAQVSLYPNPSLASFCLQLVCHLVHCSNPGGHPYLDSAFLNMHAQH